MKRFHLLFVLVFYFLGCNAQAIKYENLVFEGAGIRGIAYAGVLKELELAGVLKEVQNVAGTSAGAITALMVSLKYNSDEIYRKISATKFQKFNDGRYFFVGGLYRLTNKFGWYKGDEFMNWLEDIIEDKTGSADITFEELNLKGFKDLYVTATCLNKQELFVLSKERYPKMKIKDAVRASMAVPLYFEPVFIDSTGKRYKKPKENQALDLLVDGGILANFPIGIFDSLTTDAAGSTRRTANFKTIGVRIDTDEQIAYDALGRALAPVEINNIKDYLSGFYTVVLENLNREQLIPEDWDRTISVSSKSITPKVKRLSALQKSILIESGENSTKAFFTIHQ